jgi:hypothetical protein
MSSDYERILRDAILRIGELARQRDELEVEKAKLFQLMRATINLLPDDRREAWGKMIDAAYDKHVARLATLTDAIRNVLRAQPRQWFTVTVMRDSLVRAGFDFSEYASNPLASVSTTLKRMAEKGKEAEVEAQQIEQVTAYRWKKRHHRLGPPGIFREYRPTTLPSEEKK